MDNHKSMASRLKELFQFLSTTSGDLANVTGPPGMLAPSSVVEVGHCWAQRPAVFAAPALEPAPDRRCLLVLRMILIALRSQMYVGGGSTTTSIKKPLNAFLGELFLAEWTDERPHGSSSSSSNTAGSGSSSSSSSSSRGSSRDGSSGASTTTRNDAGTITPITSSGASSCSCGGDKITTRLIAEQVSHHPPITAMHLRDEEHGIRADGYARVEMTFGGSIQVKQVGHAVVRIDAYDEEYLMPLPDIKVRGFLAGRLYPEITDTYHVVGSNGYAAEIVFSGQGMAWGGKRNAFVARVYDRAGAAAAAAAATPPQAGKKSSKKDYKSSVYGDRAVLYILEGVWSEGWTVRDARTNEVLERYEVDHQDNAPVSISIPHIDEQDPWESRRAWSGVLDGLVAGNLHQTVQEKSKIEQAQRRMRAQEQAAGEAWEPLLFKSASEGPTHEAFHRLAAGTAWELHADRTKGVWRVDDDKVKNLQRPFRGSLTPLG